MFVKRVLPLWLLLMACAPGHQPRWPSRCTTDELMAFQEAAFLQVDRIEQDWVVFLSGDSDERFLRRTCLAPSLQEGDVFHFGLIDPRAKIQLQQEICSLLQRVSNERPGWCFALGERVP